MLSSLALKVPLIIRNCYCHCNLHRGRKIKRKRVKKKRFNNMIIKQTVHSSEARQTDNTNAEREEGRE